MSARNPRIDELLIDQAVFGLDATEAAELEALLDSTADAGNNPYMETAALIQLGMAALDADQRSGMPADLRNRLAAGAPRK